MYGNRRLIGILVLVTVVLASVQVVGAETAQSWHLLDAEYPEMKADGDTTHHKDFFMNKTGNAVGEYMVLPNVTTKTTWWYAEYPAQFDGVTFGEDDWTVNISHSNPGDTPCTIFANVCKVNDTTGEVIYLANGSEYAPTGATVTNIQCNDVSYTTQTFNTSERLTLKIYHNRAGTTTTLRIYYYNATGGKYSNLTSPTSDPGYPVPELSTLILFSTGLIALAGYVLLTKRRK